ncbi:hypothetical protein [Streptomyces griseosporeus]
MSIVVAAGAALQVVTGVFLFGALLLFVCFAAFAMVLLARSAPGQDSDRRVSTAEGPGGTPAPGQSPAMFWWTVAGVVLTAIAVVIALAELLHSW